MSFDDLWRQELAGETDSPQPAFKLPVILSHPEVMRLLQAAPLRCRPCLRLLYAAGLRPEELWQILPLPPNRIQVNGRCLSLDEETARQLPGMSMPEHLNQLQDDFLEAARLTGLHSRFSQANRTLTLQSLRHACAHHCLAAGMDLNCLYHQLGHRWVDLTEMYLRTAITLLGSVYATTHPLMQGQQAPSCWSHSQATMRELPQADEEETLRTAPFARLTPDEIQLLMQAADRPRHRLMIRTFYASGLRLSELLELRYFDLCPEQCSLFINDGKLGKDRYCLVDPLTMQQLLEHQQNRPPEERIFAISQNVADRNLRDLMKRTGLFQKYTQKGQKVSSHCLRNTFATHLYQAGASLYAIRMLLGHSNLQTTLCYLDCPFEHRQKAYNLSHAG